MRWDWGIGMAVLFGTFAVGILVMVAVSSSQRVDLVADNYYEQELRYEDRLHEIRSAREFPLRWQQREDQLDLDFSALTSEIAGDISFYRPSDASKDVTMKLQLTSTRHQTISVKAWDKGLWRMKVSWHESEKRYYREMDIVLK
jgi:nitrogen fixation protein FixH